MGSAATCCSDITQSPFFAHRCRTFQGIRWHPDSTGFLLHPSCFLLSAPSTPSSACRVNATYGRWSRLDIQFSLPGAPSQGSPCPQQRIYLEGPPGGVDILASYFGILGVPSAPVVQGPRSVPLTVLPEFDEVSGQRTVMGIGLATLYASKSGGPVGPSACVMLCLLSLTCAHPLTPNATLNSVPKPHTLTRLCYPVQSRNIVLNGRFTKGTSQWETMAHAGSLTAYLWSPGGSLDGPPILSSALPPAWPAIPPLQTSKFTASANSSAQNNGLQNGGPVVTGQAGAPLALLAGPTGPYVRMSGRRENWHGPCQQLKGRLKPMTTYAVTAWVRVAKEGSWGVPGASKTHGDPPGVNLCLSANGSWINCGTVEASWKEWVRCWGSFRMEGAIESATFYAQGPGACVDILLADVRVEEVDWRARVPELKARTDQVCSSHGTSTKGNPGMTISAVTQVYLFCNAGFAVLEIPSAFTQAGGDSMVSGF